MSSLKNRSPEEQTWRAKIRELLELILFLDQKVTSEKKSAIMIKGENYGKEI